MLDRRSVTNDLSVGAQIDPQDIPALAEAGVRSIISNRPDGEAPDQPTFAEIAAAAEAAGIEARHIPVVSGRTTPGDADAFGLALARMPAPVHAFCRTGTRSITLWAMDNLMRGENPIDIISTAQAAGYDMRDVAARVRHAGITQTVTPVATHDIVIIGGGAAGIAVASSLLARESSLDIAIVEPSDIHFYQPGWTLVGGGVFDPLVTRKDMARLIPRGARWIKAAVSGFEPAENAIVLDGCHTITYKRLIVAPGLKLDWDAIEGLPETLGHNGVTSNYRYDLAPYTWQLVQELQSGRAVFTQPPMPIKCAGAPQKAMYLSADHWLRHGRIPGIRIDFFNAGAVLFGVSDYVPALMEYVERYQATLNFGQTLTRIDGPARRACFSGKGEDGTAKETEVAFDMLHVVPPQTAPDFVRASPLADAAGWIDVDRQTLRHKTYENIWSLGDVMNAPNAKTAAAARKQAPVVANNVLADIGLVRGTAHYDGYGSCPLTVERGRIVLAEFGYEGKLLPSFPKWMIDGTKPSRLSWFLKERVLPPVYWKAMLTGREWLAKPETVD